MFGRQGAHAGAAPVHGFKQAASGQSADRRPHRIAVDLEYFGKLAFGGQAFVQLPAAFNEILLQLSFDPFLLAYSGHGGKAFLWGCLVRHIFWSVPHQVASFLKNWENMDITSLFNW